MQFKSLKIWAFALLSSISCSVQNTSVWDYRELLIGEWSVTEVSFIGDSRNIPKPDQTSLWAFFGTDVLGSSEGKRLTFSESGLFSTNLIPENALDRYQISYSVNDNELVFRVLTQGGEREEVTYISWFEVTSDGDSLTWDIDHLFKLSLVKSGN